MHEIEGKVIFTEIEEIVDSSHTTIVVLDVQNIAIDMIFNKDEFIANLNSLIHSSRKRRISFIQ